MNLNGFENGGIDDLSDGSDSNVKILYLNILFIKIYKILGWGHWIWYLIIL